MMRRVGGVICTATAALAVAAHLVQAQIPPTYIPDIKFASGRSVVPYLEGWIRNPDETFDFVFGYLNRNTEEELVIPPGPDNSVMPDGPDRGQPTYFAPRRQPRIFRVRVPKDWGKKDLVWTLIIRGRTEKAYASLVPFGELGNLVYQENRGGTEKVVSKLLPAEEINEHIMIANGNNTMRFGEEDLNKPPTLAVAPIGEATAGAPVSLTASVTDDGLPKPRAPVAPRPTEPTSRFQSQRNTSSNPNAMIGLRLTWVAYRGPGKVTFETNPVRVVGDKTTTTARFAAPGTYTLVALASDGRLSTRKDITVTVK